MADTDKEQKEAENADKKAQQDQEKVLKKEATKKVVSTCSINLDNIFVLLHTKAASNVKGCKIENSAIEGEGNKVKFHGAGSHIIAAVPLKGEEITLQDAFTGIKLYVTWFNGPDVANKIKEEDLITIEDNATSNTETKKESIIPYIPSFLTYLTEKGESNKDDIELRKDKLSKKSNQELDRRKEKRDPKNTTAKGFYITYKIAIEGQKESPLTDALKSFGAGLLKGLGVLGFSWKTGAKGKEHTIGDLLDTLDKVFGKIDPNELKTRFAKNVQAKYPLTKATDVQFYDKKTLTKYLGKKLDAKQKLKIATADYSLCYKVDANDKSKKLINVTVVADAITRSIKGLFKKFKNKVDSKDVILVNDYSESDNDQKKAEKKLEVNTNDKKPLTTDSMKVRSGKMLSEADDKKDDKKDKANDTSTDKKQEANLSYVNERLPKIAADALKDNFEKDASTKAYTKAELKSIISETDEPDLFKELSDKPDSSGTINYAYVIKTLWYEFKNTNDKPTGESIDHSTVNSMLKMLFEEADDKNDKAEKLKVDEKNKKIEEAVNKAFKVLFEDAKLKETNGKDYKPVDFKVYSILAKDDLTEKKDNKKTVADSLKFDYSFVNRLFESNEFNDELQLILEASKGIPEINEIIDKVGTKNITANKDKINRRITFHYNNPNQNLLKKDINAAFDKIYSYDDADKLKTYIENTYKGYKQDKNGIGRIANAIATCLSEAGLPEKEPEEEPPTTEEHPEPTPPEPTPPEPIPEEIKKLQAGFIDADPDKDEGDDPEYVEFEKGGSVTPPKAKYSSDKNEFIGWKDQTGQMDNFDGLEEPMTYMALYKGITPNKFPVVFMDQDFENGSTIDLDTQWIEKGKSATAPTEPNHEAEGWKFKEWSDTFDKIEGPKNIIALYDQIIKIIAKAPKDPEKPDDTLEPILKDPAIYDPNKKLEEQLPTPPDYKDKGYDFDKWDPSPDTIENPKEDINITATYKKNIEKPKEDESKVEKKHKYWICLDVNKYLTPKDLSIKQNHTGIDFYIVPMKGLKMDTTDKDDSKEAEGKGK